MSENTAAVFRLHSLRKPPPTKDSDAVAPLSNLTPEASANAVKTALGLLGNASANLSKERRKLVVKTSTKMPGSWLRTMTDDLSAPMRRV